MLGKKVIDSSWKFLNENGNKMSLENYPVNQVINNKKALKNFIVGVYRPPKKDMVWVLANAVPEFGRDGKISQVIVTFMDITDLKRTEEQLRESEETKKALLNAPTDTAMLIDIEGTILAVNETGAQKFGSSVDKIVGLHIHQYLPPDLAKKRLDQGKKVVSSGKPVLFEDERKGKYFENRIYPIFDNEGTVSKLAIFARDITENRQAQEEREKLVRKLQEALEEVKTLSGLLPICSECKKIRDDKGYWNQLEVYVQDHSEAEFSHGICPDCLEKIYGDQEWYKKKFGKK
jgi:PAS domain S-box-containing protein